MKKYFWIGTAIIMFIFSSISADTFAADSGLAALREKYGVPALGAGYVKDGKFVAFIDGVRKLGDPTLAGLGDSFHLGSDTKAMTATLLAIFIERGKLKWTSTLGDLLGSEIKKMDSRFSAVTVEMLTAHRSGVTGDLIAVDGGKFWSHLWDKNLQPRDGRRFVAADLLTRPPGSPPGSKFEYSNANYIIVGHILENLTGKSWEELMTDEIFKPLKMASCGFGAAGDPDAKVADQPWGHRLGKDGKPQPVKPDFHGDNPPTLGPAGSVHCSMEDWARFLQIHIDGDNGKPTPILKSFAKLHQSYPGQQYTDGGWIRAEQDGGMVLTHDGSNTFNYVTAWLVPQKNLAFFSVANIGGDRALTATHEAVALMLKAVTSAK